MLGPNRFLRTAWLFSATDRLEIPEHRISLRAISPGEAAQMAQLARARNVFSRHGSDDAFYLERIGKLAGASVLESFYDGDIDAGMSAVKHKSALFEQMCLISASFGLSRARMQNLLSVSGHRRFGFDFAIGDGFAKLRSAARKDAAPKGVPVTPAFARRFHRMGFADAFGVAVSTHPFAARIQLALTWQAESLLDSSRSAALVKSAIALESLLVANEQESLRGPISERAAYLLAGTPETRKRISRAMKKLYDFRSALVHGGRKKATVLPDSILDGADRIVALLILGLAHNSERLTSFDALTAWVDELKWGAATARSTVVFPQSHLTRTLNLLEGK